MLSVFPLREDTANAVSVKCRFSKIMITTVYVPEEQCKISSFSIAVSILQNDCSKEMIQVENLLLLKKWLLPQLMVFNLLTFCSIAKVSDYYRKASSPRIITSLTSWHSNC